MPVTQRDIAQKLGVSRRLVGYALNGEAGVGDEMRQRIKDEAAQMGYRQNRVAQALSSGRTYQIALCFPFLGSSYFNELIRQFEILAQGTAYNLLMITYDPFGFNQSRQPGAGINQSVFDSIFAVDGMIVVGSAIHLPVTISYPVVSLYNEFRGPLRPGEANLDRVQIGIGRAATETMEHLLERGFRRIAYAAAESMLFEQECRYHAYQTAMQKAGLDVEVIPLTFSAEQLIRQRSHCTLKEYFTEHGLPEALFCCNDDIAIGACRALRELGKTVAGDTAVVGFDDLDDVKYLETPMTAVHMPIEAACSAAWKMLMRRIGDANLPPMHENFEAHLVVRESTLVKSPRLLSVG